MSSKDLIDAYIEIVNSFSNGSAGRCAFCGAYNQYDFRLSSTDQYKEAHKPTCIAVKAYNYLINAGEHIDMPNDICDYPIVVGTERHE